MEFAGKVTDVDRSTSGGFLRGVATISGLDNYRASSLELSFQNEHLAVVIDDAVITTAPDLIAVVETSTGNPITTENLRYGQRVSVVTAPCDDRWHSPEGLELVGPRAFGLSYGPVRWNGQHTEGTV